MCAYIQQKEKKQQINRRKRTRQIEASECTAWLQQAGWQATIIRYKASYLVLWCLHKPADSETSFTSASLSLQKVESAESQVRCAPADPTPCHQDEDNPAKHPTAAGQTGSSTFSNSRVHNGDEAIPSSISRHAFQHSTQTFFSTGLVHVVTVIVFQAGLFLNVKV